MLYEVITDLTGAMMNPRDDTEPERLLLKSHGEKFTHRQRHATIKGKTLGDIADARRFAAAAEHDPALIADFTQ